MYSIIIPVFNEQNKLPKLLKEIKFLSSKGHEIIFINDGSTDNTYQILNNCNYIKIINIKNNQGKGTAIKLGIDSSTNNKIIIFDGDMELQTNEIENLMILDRRKETRFVLGSRFKKFNIFSSIWSFGNFLLTQIFNYVHNSHLEDALCCSKAFYKEDLSLSEIRSKKFDIDVELTSLLIKKLKFPTIIHISYLRRNFSEGKKLKLSDGLKILFRILRS